MDTTGDREWLPIAQSQLMDLLLRWEELQELGQPVTAEELCAECTEQLPKLRECIAALRDVDALLFDPAIAGDLAQGNSIAGYTILNECGRGGMGIVYRAFDTHLRREVALKTLKRLDPSALYRFKKEFRALSGVTHANLVSLHELAFDGEFWFFTMEYVKGVSFVQYVRPETSPFDFDRLRETLRQLTEGVLALHSANILHRDLKPSNVLVTELGRVVVLDFGLSTVLDDAGQHQSTEHHVLGTAAYMAPEQGAGESLTRAADWYSVGVMLYEALTGHLPFVGASTKVLNEKLEREPTPPIDLNSSVPIDLDSLCQGLLRRDPLERLTGVDLLNSLSQSGPVSNELSAPTARAGKQLVGREEHLVALKAAFETVCGGGRVVLLVHGNSGVGKSALLQRFVDDCVRSTDAVLLAGRCYERESVPYKAFDSIVDALADYLRHLPTLEAQALLPRDVFPMAQVFPMLRRIEAVADRIRRPLSIPEAQHLRRRAFAGLREILARIGDRRPLVIYIDDLQWGDADSAALLIDVMSPPEPPSILVLGAFRREEIASSPFLKAIEQWRKQSVSTTDQRQLSVDVLSISDSTRLAEMLLKESRTVGVSATQTVARESGGNPFFIHELVEFIRRHDASSEVPFVGTIALEEVIWKRISGLPDNARRLLEVTSVAGRPIPQADACRAAGIPITENSAGILLRSGRLIRSTIPDQDEIETYHDRVREIVVARLACELCEKTVGLTVHRPPRGIESNLYSCANIALMPTECKPTSHIEFSPPNR